MVDRVILVHRSIDRTVDGIRDHGDRLALELSKHVAEVTQEPSIPSGATRDRRAWLKLWRRLRRLDRGSTVFVQYSPFCFARWGFAPWLPIMMLALRSSQRRPLIAVMIHEPYVPMISWQWTLMGLWQRFQLAGLRLAADVLFTSIEPWARRFEAQHPKRPVHHLPIGSNFPDRRSHREQQREQMEVDGGTIVATTLGRDHRSWLGDYVVEAVNAISATGRPVVLQVLGASAPQVSGLAPAVRVEQPGYLDDEEFAARLAASDIFLIPLEDGVSTRRTAMMSALQHGLPVVGTEGELTDPLLREAVASLRIVPVEDRERFAGATAELAADPAARAEMGASARQLYERNFAWPGIADKLLASLPGR